MRVVANSIPKSGTHLLDRLLVLLGFGLVDLGGIRPHLAKSSDRFPLLDKRLGRHPRTSPTGGRYGDRSAPRGRGPVPPGPQGLEG